MPKSAEKQAIVLLAALLFLRPATVAGQGPDSTLRTGHWIEQASVTAYTPEIRVASDTVNYAVASLLTDPDASAEELLQKIPGLEIADDGTLVLHGKAVRQLLIDGRRFYDGDIRSILRNIPAEMVARVSAYDRPSDVMRLSGVDDALEQQVLDIHIKEKYARRWHNSLRAGGGIPRKTDAKYSGNKLGDGGKISLNAGYSKLSPIQNSLKNSLRMGTGSAGNTAAAEADATFSTAGQRSSINGSIQFSHSDKAATYRQYNDYFRANGSRRTEVDGDEQARKDKFSAQSVVEWQAGARTSIVVKPKLEFSLSDGTDRLDTRSFRESPAPVYRSERNEQARNRSLRAGTSFQLTRRLGKKGRTFSSFTDLGFRSGNDALLARTTMHYYTAIRRDTLQQRDRQSDTRTHEYNLVQQFLWNEPLGGPHFLQLSYRQTLRRTLSDRNNWILDGGAHTYDDEHSAAGTYDYLAGNLSLNYRFKRPRVKLTAGIALLPTRTSLRFPGSGQFRDTSIRRLRLAPNLSFNYAREKGASLQLTYKTMETTPKIAGLLPVSSNTNPLYIQMPNTGLRPSFTHDARIVWIATDKYARRSLSLTGFGQWIEDDFSNSTRYNEASGGRLVTPVNIEGNRSAGFDAVLHAALKQFLLSSQTSGEWTRENAFLYNNASRADERNQIRRRFLRETLVLTRRGERFEASLAGGFQAVAEQSSLRPELDRKYRQYWAGTSFIWKSRIGLTLSSDLKALALRGLPFSDVNGNYAVWNAKISQNLLGEKLLIQFEGTDMLGQLDNITTVFSAERRGIAYYNGASQNFLLRLVWKFDC